MKKLAALLCLLLLLACVPTPEKEAVVYRGDDATPNPARVEHADLSAIPEHLYLTSEPQKGVTLQFDADVKIDRNGTFPILEVRALDTVADPAFCERLLSLLCPDGKVYERWQPTKAELKEELLAATAYDGRWGSIFEMEDMPEILKYFEETYRTAPDEPQRTAVDPRNGFLPNHSYYIERQDGGTALLTFPSERNGGTWVDDSRTDYGAEDFIEPGDPPLDEPPISEREAIAQADALLASLGVECTSLLCTERGFGWRLYDRTESVWMCTYVRKVGTTNSNDQRRVFGYQYPRDAATALGAPWEGVEYIRVTVGSKGICEVWWSGLCKTIAVTEPDAALCDFDQILARFQEQLGYRYAMPEGGVTISIETLKLTYGVVSEKDRRGYGLYIPMWELCYRTDTDDQAGFWKIYLSALDGSTVEPRITTDSLLRKSQNP